MASPSPSELLRQAKLLDRALGSPPPARSPRITWRRFERQ